MEVIARGQNAVPVYHPNKKTGETLAAIYDDLSLENIYCKPPSGRLLFHWLEISRMHQLIDKAVSLTDEVSIPAFYNEWEPINKDATRSCDQFSLYVEFEKNPPLVCAPDAGFLVEKDGHRKVFYLEIDRGTDSIKRICSKKPKGYARLQALKRHRKHFPAATVESFSVLFVTTTDYRRDELAKRLANYEGQSHWKFACYRDVKPETFLFEPIWRGFDSEPHSLVKR